MKPKLIRITTIPESLKTLLKGQLNYMSNNGFDVIGISSEGNALYELKGEEEIEVFAVDMSRKITPFKDLVSLWHLYRFFRKEKPLIVHTHTPKAGTVGMFAAKIAGVPLRLHTVAGLPLLEEIGFKRGLLNIVEKITYYFATKIYPNSFGLSEIIKQNNFCSSHKIKVIANGSSNGIDTEYYNPNLFSNDAILQLKSKLNIKSNDFVFIYVGRLVSHKGINELVKAFIDFQNLNINSKLLLVGDYETELDPLEYDTIKIIENDSNIISVGYQMDVRPFFAISNCLVFPSYREGFPNVVMQAGAMGLPCIVSNINGCNEIIQEGLNGVIIPYKDKNAIVEKMKKISQDTLYYKKISKDTRKIIIEKYEQLFVWKTLLLEYNNLIKSI